MLYPDSDTIVQKHQLVMASVQPMSRPQEAAAERYHLLASRAVARNHETDNQPTHVLMMVMFHNWKATVRRLRGDV